MLVTERTNKSDKTKIVIFLKLIDDERIKIYNTSNKTDVLNTKKIESLDEVLKKFEKHCV